MSKFCTGARGFNHQTQSCCERHDHDYQHGSGVSRMQADVKLMTCVANNGMPWRAIAMFIAVRLFGWARYQGGH